MDKLILNTNDFLIYAQSVQSQDWYTLSQQKKFTYHVDKSGIILTPSTGEARTITISEINKFCHIFSEFQSYRTSDYSSLFNKSYLLALAKKYRPIPQDYTLPEEILNEDQYCERTVKRISVNRYERNSIARGKCIQHHGAKCIACDFDFGSVYGDYADGFIHVHHLTPISSNIGTGSIDPIHDLVPICPNCHAVIHLRGECLTIDELKELLSRSRKAK